MTPAAWPSLPLDAWLPTYDTLHRWVQIVGKTRLALSPTENHWWHAALYVTARGLTTSPMPFDAGTVEVSFDFLNDSLVIQTNAGRVQTLPLEARPVADFYRAYRAALADFGVSIHMVPTPNEVQDATPFADDVRHASYDGDAVRRWWQALTQADRALKDFRGRFVGKSSPSHLWWGGLDLACTRFSGRTAPPHGGGVPNCPDSVMLEAYSHECISAGWWPGTVGSPVAEPAFYAYAYPEPTGCSAASIGPTAARYDRDMREWILPYDAVREASDPFAMISEFLESTYETAATLGGWDLGALRSSRGNAPRNLSSLRKP
jgi:hypothetical protein